MIRFILNDKEIETNLPPGMVVLDFLRYHQRMTGTKIGCREGDCGACTVLIGELRDGEMHYQSMTSCLLPLGNIKDKHVVSIEGINFPDRLNPVQQAMADAGATQCGFCTPGFVMSLAGFCLSGVEATNESAIASVDGNICRCTGYKSIERAASRVADLIKDRKGEDPPVFVSRKKILPDYFATIRERLDSIKTIAPLTDYPVQPASLVAGGTDLYVQKHDEMTQASLGFTFDQPRLKGIYREGNSCWAGPSVTVTDLKNSQLIRDAFPDFQRYAKLVSSTPIRNMATLGGNFVNASPIGDFTIFFLALDARLTLVRAGKENGTDTVVERTVPLRGFYKGYKILDKTPEEQISQIQFDLPGKDSYFNFEKVSKRTHLDIASVNSAIHLKMKGGIIEKAGISAGGVAPTPLFLEKTSKYPEGKKMSVELIRALVELAGSEITPISDARGTKEYKRFLLGQLLKAHFLKFFPELRFDDLLVS